MPEGIIKNTQKKAFLDMIVLGIESTCDETSAACVQNGKEILSHVIASQVDIHAVYGGVVPEIASRHHIDDCLPVIDSAIKKANISLSQVDLIAVSEGPGLIGSLLVGIHTAKTLAWSVQKPLVGVNHIEAHLYAAMMSKECSSMLHDYFPALGLVLSGGHTSLVYIHDVGRYTLLGQTVDDAIGEAFDKVAKMMGLAYPGGPHIERHAAKGDPTKYPLKAGHVKNAPYNFSFSGLKTGALYALREARLQSGSSDFSENLIADISASFQLAAFTDIAKKIELALKDSSIPQKPKALFLGGGVVQNTFLRKMLTQQFEDSIPLFWPEKELCLDNAAMIAGLGYHVYIRDKVDEKDILSPRTRIPFEG